MRLVHPLIQNARGALTDEDRRAAEYFLSRAVDAAKDLEDVRRDVQAVIREWQGYPESYPRAAFIEDLRKALR